MNRDDATEIMKEVRDFYRENLKSSNKTYEEDQDEPSEKQLKRNKLSKEAEKLIDDFRADSFPLKKYGEIDSFVKYGKLIDSLNLTAGNCMEMASLAAWLVSKKDKNIHISILMSLDPGDHVCCLLGSCSGWSIVGQVPESCAASIIIDPWANICCYAAEYPVAFDLKMKAWTGQGKRITVGGAPAPPAGKFMSNFLGARTDIYNARNSIVDTTM